jgi:hypothetical protein
LLHHSHAGVGHRVVEPLVGVVEAVPEHHQTWGKTDGRTKSWENT